MIVLFSVLSSCSVDDHAAAVFDVLESLERLVQVANQLGQLVGSGLTDVTFVHDQYDFDLLVDIEQSLHEEGVGDLVLLSLVVLEARTVVEGHLLDDDFGGNRGLRVLLVTDFDARFLHCVEDGLESIESHDQLRASQEGHDGALADTSVSNHDNSFRVFSVDGNSFDACVDESLEFVKIDRI